ncbi:hypothetical protein KCTC52924_01845 [Arenibacter antarcticus]|uniref:Uncharacterized protein n=1 Tax=Arenibacter antarcticus TaxID=2040469 RepID=A0ABW5VL38_9FLAO|nr:hypothetical protein [Arenibacter sp. H213]
MKKSDEQSSLNSKVGKRWTLDSKMEEDSTLPDNFILGMTNQPNGYNSN